MGLKPCCFQWTGNFHIGTPLIFAIMCTLQSNSCTLSFLVMLQPTDEVSDRSKHKFMVQSLGLEEDVSVDDLDATVRHCYVYTCMICLTSAYVVCLLGHSKYI